jgi:protease I
MTKIAYLIAHKNFRDEEYFIPKLLFESSGYQVDTYSDQEGQVIGSEGGDVMAENLNDIKVNEYKAVIVAGGGGALKYLDNEKVYSLLNEFEDKKKIIASICISPVVLARAGILKGRKATVWHSAMDKSAIKILEKEKVEYLDEDVVCDGRIITANGPEAAEKFARRVIENL